MTTSAFPVPTMQPSMPTVRVADDDDIPRNVHKSTIYKLGIIEIVHGCLLCALCVASIICGYIYNNLQYYYINIEFTFISPGIWCGMFAIISGGLGVCTKKKPSVCMYKANLVMSIISAIFMGILFSSSIFFTFMVGEVVIIVLQGVMAVVSLSAMIINIVHSVYCCAGVCCLKRKGGVILPNTTTTIQIVNGQQYVQLPNGQYALLRAQPFLGSGEQVTSIPNTGMPVPAQFPQPGLPQYAHHQVDHYKQVMSSGQPPSYDDPSFPAENHNQL